MGACSTVGEGGQGRTSFWRTAAGGWLPVAAPRLPALPPASPTCPPPHARRSFGAAPPATQCTNPPCCQPCLLCRRLACHAAARAPRQPADTLAPAQGQHQRTRHRAVACLKHVLHHGLHERRHELLQVALVHLRSYEQGETERLELGEPHSQWHEWHDAAMPHRAES